MLVDTREESFALRPAGARRRKTRVRRWLIRGGLVSFHASILGIFLAWTGLWKDFDQADAAPPAATRPNTAVASAPSPRKSFAAAPLPTARPPITLAKRQEAPRPNPANDAFVEEAARSFAEFGGTEPDGDDEEPSDEEPVAFVGEPAPSPAPVAVKAAAQKGGDRAERAVAMRLEALAAARSRYETTRDNARRKALDAFDSLLRWAEKARGVDVADRAIILDDLRTARGAFVESDELTPMLAMQPVYAGYILAVRKAYSDLARTYDATLKALPSGDGRREELETEVRELIREVNRLDTLQPGKVWEGARSDVKPPPRIEYNPQSCRRFQLVQDPAVNIDCAFKVTERRGSYIAGEMSQNGGAAAWRVEGQFDGVTLSLETRLIQGEPQMIRGGPRRFAYKGPVVGGLGFLYMQGIKVDGNPTEGNIVLELRP